MDTHLDPALTPLAKGALLRIPEGQGKSIAVFRGSVWVTQDGDPRDVVLEPGESFIIDHAGLTILQGLADSSVLVLDAPAAAAAAAPAPRDVDAHLGAGFADAVAPAMSDSLPRIGWELHRHARQLRNEEFARLARLAAAALRRLWAGSGRARAVRVGGNTSTDAGRAALPASAGGAPAGTNAATQVDSHAHCH